MFFTKVGAVVAALLVVAGVVRAGVGLAIALTSEEIISPRYLGSSTTGEAINQGSLVFLVGTALGILVEISRSVASKT